MKRLGHMLGDAIGRGEVIRAARAQAVMREWRQIVGEGLAQKSYPDRYDKGTVWVAVQGSAWAQELRMMKGQILEKLNGRARERIFSLILQIRSSPGFAHGTCFPTRSSLPSKTRPYSRSGAFERSPRGRGLGAGPMRGTSLIAAPASPPFQA